MISPGVILVVDITSTAGKDRPKLKSVSLSTSLPSSSSGGKNSWADESEKSQAEKP